MARLVARPDVPAVKTDPALSFGLLSATTEGILSLLGIRDNGNRSVTEEEIAASLEEGFGCWRIEAMSTRWCVFRFGRASDRFHDDPRGDIAWLNMDALMEESLAVIAEHGFSRYPVCRGGGLDVLGVITAQQLLHQLTQRKPTICRKACCQRSLQPETFVGHGTGRSTGHLTPKWCLSSMSTAPVQGVITLRDVFGSHHGRIHPLKLTMPGPFSATTGSWLIDGLIQCLS